MSTILGSGNRASLAACQLMFLRIHKLNVNIMKSSSSDQQVFMTHPS